MNKSELIKRYKSFLEEYNLKPEQLILGAGGALLMYGLREVTDDLDLELTDTRLLNEIRAKPSVETYYYYGDVAVVQYGDKIDLHYTKESEIVETQFVEGVCCYTPAMVLKQKLKMNREKDQKDIQALKKMLG